MEQKIKFIVIGLAAAVLVCLVFLLQTLGVNSRVSRERDDLQKENSSLSGKLEKLQEGTREYESRMNELRAMVQQAQAEKEEADKKYELADRARQELMEKLKEAKSAASAVITQQVYSQPEPVQPVVTDAYWAGILKAKTDLEIQLAGVRSELKTIQISNEKLEREKSAYELDMTGLKREKDDLQRQFEYNKKLMDSIAQELVRERNDKMLIEDQIKPLKSENQMLTRQLKGLSRRKINLEVKLQGLADAKDSLERRITEMETMLTDRISQINSLKDQLDGIRRGEKMDLQPHKKEAVELPAIVVRPQPDKQPAPEEVSAPTSGKVIAVNKENNFIIVNLGEGAGMRAGISLKVYRDAKEIAYLEVIQARKDISACDIKKEFTPIRIGDSVR